MIFKPQDLKFNLDADIEAHCQFMNMNKFDLALFLSLTGIKKNRGSKNLKYKNLLRANYISNPYHSAIHL